MAERLSNYDLSDLHILLAEPNEFMRRALVSVLRSLNIRKLTSAGTVVAAWDRFCEDAFDAVLCDWSPDFDGLAFAQRIRQDPKSPDRFAPVIMLSAFSEREHVLLARDHGISSFIAKPVSAKMIYRRLVQIIERDTPFVRTKTYFGPDRRHKVIDIPPAEDRRRSAPKQ